MLFQENRRNKSSMLLKEGQETLLGSRSYTNTWKKGRNPFPPKTFHKYEGEFGWHRKWEVMLLRKTDPQSPDVQVMLKTDARRGELRETLNPMTSVELTDKQQKSSCFLERNLFCRAEGGAQTLRKTFQKSSPHSKYKVKAIHYYLLPVVCWR